MPAELSLTDAPQDHQPTVEELKRELADAQRREAATAEVLRIIRGSPADIQRAFETISRSAAHLCGAFDVVVLRVDGDVLRLVAHHGPLPAGDVALHRGTLAGRAVIERRLIQVQDLQAEVHEFPEGSALARQRGIRTVLSVPLLKDNVGIGNIQVRRDAVRPFSDQQIALLHTFADQAVIAIENTRLFEAEQARTNELSAALEQQTATSEVLSVISSSPTDTQPVFSAIARNAVRLCNAVFGAVFSFDGTLVHFIAGHQVTEDALRLWREEYPISPRGLIRLAITERAVVNVGDMFEDPRVANIEVARKLGSRSQLVVPMLQGDEVIGTINVYGAEPVPFSGAQIMLLRTFADQAVIAIENARLFEAEQASKRELQESLEYQTATSDVLNIIGRSPTDARPAFDVIAKSAARLCAAQFCHVFRFDGRLLHFSASQGLAPEAIALIRQGYPMLPARASISGRAILSGAVEVIPDIDSDAAYARADTARAIGYRSIVAVPMLRDSQPVGAIVVGRGEPGLFSSNQIDLLQTFADQAVIAIENTRLFEAEQASKRELQEALEYQTAISNVLSVISHSPNDLQPVFDAIVTTARTLCQSENAFVMRLDPGDGKFHVAAASSDSPEMIAYVKSNPAPPGRASISGRVAIEHRVVHVVDTLNDPEMTYADLGAASTRTRLGVPLLKDGSVIGVIVLNRRAVMPFSERQVALITAFADQAVIAIENTRLFEAEQASKRELQESLEYQTATSDVLSVISHSPDQLQPVLDVITETAVRLCRATHGHVRLLREDGAYHIAAHQIPDAELLELMRENPFRPGMDSVAGRVALQGVTVQVADVSADPLVGGFQRQISDKVKTAMGVPLKRGGKVVGIISVWHTHVQPFTERQTKLVETFAEQAVIAMNNAGLFEEVQARTRELQESLEYQTATSDVLGVISRSKFDLQPVLDSIVETAARLCACDMATIRRREGDVYVQLGGYGLPADYADYSRTTNWHHAGRGSLVGRVLQEGKAIQIVDALTDPEYTLDEAQRRGGFRTMLGVPLLRDDDQVGIIVLMRRAVQPFSDRQIELVTAFADQAVIAIENTRLFEEVQARTRELAKTVEDLEVASQHKSQFVANMSHELRTPLAAILGYAELMQEGFYEAQGPKSLDALTRIRSNGKHLLGLINTVLDIAKIESGQFSLNLGEYAVESVVETVRAATESLAETKKLALKTEVAKSLPFGLGDEQRLTQVLLNLVGNAIKFTDSGEVRVTASAANSNFTVSVIDTGPGIPADQVGRVFEQFHQVDSSNTKAKGGTGLGLAISKQIVEMHGGRIWVESILGKGSTFHMQLPVRAASKGAS